MLVRRGRAEGMSWLRDEIRAVAAELGLEDAAANLDKLIDALLGTRKAALSALAARPRPGVRRIAQGAPRADNAGASRDGTGPVQGGGKPGGEHGVRCSRAG